MDVVVATSIRVSMSGQCEQYVMGECWELLAGFVGIGLEKSISVMVHDTDHALREWCPTAGYWIRMFVLMACAIGWVVLQPSLAWIMTIFMVSHVQEWVRV